MSAVYGARDIVRNPKLLRIDANDSYIIEDKKAHKRLGIYLGVELADKFFDYQKKQELLESAKKIKESANKENELLDGTLSDEL